MLLIILLVAIADFLIGTFIPRDEMSEDRDRGFTGYSGTWIAFCGGLEQTTVTF